MNLSGASDHAVVFIASARQDAPYLLAELRSSRRFLNLVEWTTIGQEQSLPRLLWNDRSSCKPTLAFRLSLACS